VIFLKEKNIYKKISKYQNIVIARHIGPDPDAIASQMALRDSIKLTFPNKNVYAVGVGVSKFKYFGLLDKIDEMLIKDALLIVLDVPNIGRIDGITFSNYKEVIKIDHHPYEDKMGSLEITDVSASSTSELIADLINNTRLKMNEKIAKNIFIGIAADSDRFLFPTTSPRTFNIAAKLVKDYHIDLKDAYANLYERPLAEFRFQAFIALNMTVTENGFGYMKLTNEMIKEYNVDASSASNMVNNFNYIKEVIAWAFVSFDEKQELFKVNIRSRGPVINDIASKYNGGGHKYASGARIKTEEDVNNLFAELDNACKEYNLLK
jgi:phosphoesterase RecJ-like protein